MLSILRKLFSKAITIRQIPETEQYFEPNSTPLYDSLSKAKKGKWIFLGFQNEEKIVYNELLTRELSRWGYFCYYATTIPEKQQRNNGKYEIIWFREHKDFLEQLAICSYTILLYECEDDTPEMVADSFRCNTPVLSGKNSKHADFVLAAKGFLLANEDKVLAHLLNKNVV